MSLSSSFTNAEDYFKAVVDFLHSYSWIYREANTSCLKSFDVMPKEFKDYFLQLSKSSLDVFPFIHEDLLDCPPSVEDFRMHVANLTPTSVGVSEQSVVTQRQKPNHQRKMSPKKLHEVQQLATHINTHCQDTELVVDLGSGLGYLSEALYELRPELMILGLEADENRVLAARKRCRQLLPEGATKSISFQTLYVNAASRAYIDDSSTELARNNNCLSLSKMSIIGLHACADLSIIGIQLFLAMPRVRSIHIMPCCYHKLALCTPNVDAGFVNFPLSVVLKKVVATSQPVSFNRPFLRLACQQTSARWNSNRKSANGYQMYARALAEAICDVGECIKCKKINSQSNQEQVVTFTDLQQKYQLVSNQTGQHLDWSPSHESRFFKINANYVNDYGPCLAEALTCLQTSIQKLCENVVLLDRLCYMKEKAAEANLLLRARYEQLLDEKLSPRCHVLIAEKLS